MLVLSRKRGESIIVNDNITIVVVEICGDRVRLGVEAPKEVSVHRFEVYEAIRRSEEAIKAAPRPETKKTKPDALLAEAAEEDGPALPNPT
mgnify:FL=1